MPPKTKINLLQRDLVVSSKFRHLTKYSLIVLVGYMVCALGIFSFYLFLNSNRRSLETKNEALLVQIRSGKETEGLLVTLKDRINRAKDLFSTSKPTPSDLLEKQVKLLPSGNEIYSVNAKTDGSIVLLVKSNNSQSMSQFIKSLKEQKPTAAILGSVTISEAGGYLFSVEVRE